MKNDRISVALLGAGRIGQEHAKNLAAFPQVEVVVVCDPRIEGAETLRALVRAREVTASPEEAVNRNDVDAVVICTPTDTHADLIEAAAETGKAIFCEKPVALDLTRTQQALAAVAKKGVPFQIGFQRPDAEEFGDIDTATTLLRFASGALGVVENSRRAVYGYDIVTEVFGENGKIVVQAEPKTPLREYNKDGYRLDHYHFFMDRFGPAFRAELEAFFHAISNGKTPSPGHADAVESLKIALAATRSLKEGRS